ncbi:MAG: OmpA family protein [Ferruginibacter sp.]
MPSGLNLSSVLGGLSGVANNATASVKSVTNGAVDETKEKTGRAMRMLVPLALLIAGALLVLYFSKGCNETANVATNGNDSLGINAAKDSLAAVAAGKIDSLTGDWYYDAGEMATIDLPNNGGKLTVGKNSTEYRLVNFLNDKDAVLDTAKGNWFEFTNVHFKKGGSEITDESMVQLKNMVLIAKAYPAAKFKFGGYTDSTGTDAVNVPLSQKRADAVAGMVSKLGAAKESFAGSVGYGSQWPLKSNATKEGQAQNRRVAVNVKAK